MRRLIYIFTLFEREDTKNPREMSKEMLIKLLTYY